MILQILKLLLYKNLIFQSNLIFRISIISQNEAICSICKTSVHISSKHCRECNKCVIGFDHHCKWLNNCIGKSNYKLFCFTIGSLELLMVFELSLGIYLTNDLFTNEKASFYNIEERLNLEDRKVIIGCMLVIVIIVSVIVIAVTNLIGIHIYLNIKGYTTYDYICKLREESNKQKARHNSAAGKKISTDKGPELEALSGDKTAPQEASSSKFKLRSSNKILPSHDLKSQTFYGNENYDLELTNLQAASYAPKKEYSQEVIESDYENNIHRAWNRIETFSKL